MTRGPSDLTRLGIGVAAVAAVTWLFSTWLRVANAATVSTALLLVVLLVAATSRLWVAVTTSVVAMLAFNIGFLPPVGTLTMADPAELGGAGRLPRRQPGGQQPVGGGPGARH